MKIYNIKNIKFFTVLVLIFILCYFSYKQDQYYKNRFKNLERDMTVVREVLGEEEFNIRYRAWGMIKDRLEIVGIEPE